MVSVAAWSARVRANWRGLGAEVIALLGLASVSCMAAASVLWWLRSQGISREGGTIQVQLPLDATAALAFAVPSALIFAVLVWMARRRARLPWAWLLGAVWIAAALGAYFWGEPLTRMKVFGSENGSVSAQGVTRFRPWTLLALGVQLLSLTPVLAARARNAARSGGRLRILVSSTILAVAFGVFLVIQGTRIFE